MKTSISKLLIILLLNANFSIGFAQDGLKPPETQVGGNQEGTGIDITDFAQVIETGQAGVTPQTSPQSANPQNYNTDNWDNLAFARSNGVSCPLIRNSAEEQADIESISSAITSFNSSNSQNPSCQLDETIEGQMRTLTTQLSTLNNPQVYNGLVGARTCYRDLETRRLELQLNSINASVSAYFEGNISNPPSLQNYRNCAGELYSSFSDFSDCSQGIFDELIVEMNLRCSTEDGNREIEEIRVSRERAERVEFQAYSSLFQSLGQVFTNPQCNPGDLVSPFLSIAQRSLPAMLLGGGPAFSIAQPAFEAFFGLVRDGILGSRENAQDLLNRVNQRETMNDQLCLNFELQQSALMCNERTEFLAGLLSDKRDELEAINECRERILDSTPYESVEASFTRLADHLDNTNQGMTPAEQRQRQRMLTSMSDTLNNMHIPSDSEDAEQNYPEFLERAQNDLARHFNSLGRREKREFRTNLTRALRDNILDAGGDRATINDFASNFVSDLLANEDGNFNTLIENYNEIRDYEVGVSEDASNALAEILDNQDVLAIHRNLPEILPTLVTTLAQAEGARDNTLYERLETREIMAQRIRALDRHGSDVARRIAALELQMQTNEDGTPNSSNERMQNLASLFNIQGMYVNNRNLQNHVQSYIDAVNLPFTATIGENTQATDEIKQGIIDIINSEGDIESALNRIPAFERENGIHNAATKAKLIQIHTLVSNCIIGENNLSIADNHIDAVEFENNNNNVLERCDYILQCSDDYHSPGRLVDSIRDDELNDSVNVAQIQGTMCGNMANIDNIFRDIATRYINSGELPNINSGERPNCSN